MSSLLARHGAQSLVCFGGAGERSAAQLAAYAQAIARALPTAPASEPGRRRVVLACRDRYRFSAGLLAIWQRGLIAELPANGQPASVHALAARDEVLVLLHDRDQDGPHGERGARTLDVGLDLRTLESVDTVAALPIELRLAADDVALIAYTSGSTGEPVPHEKRFVQLLREPEALLAAFDLAGRRIVVAVPPYHIYGLLFGVLVPLLGGGSMSRGAPLQPAELLRELDAAGADVLVAVPPQLTALAAYDAPRWPPLSRVFSSAAPLPASTSEALAKRGWRVTEVLGSTETGGIAQRAEPQASWQPLPSVQIAVDDTGCLTVDSPWLARDAARPLRTADRVALVHDGFRHLGRSDAVVKVGGRRIDLAELELRLTRCAGVRAARVLALASESVRGLELLAVIESDHVELSALRHELLQHVDPVALPRRFRVVSALPRGETGKVTREALLALFAPRGFPREPLADGRVAFAVPPRSDYFRGHFDAQPILPGVVQLERLALAEIRRCHPELGAVARLTRIKFKRLVTPGERLILTLERKGPLTVQFSLDSEGRPTASGILHFRPSPACGQESV